MLQKQKYLEGLISGKQQAEKGEKEEKEKAEKGEGKEQSEAVSELQD